jgi:dolichol kinase
MKEFELKRQALHVAFGASVLAVALLFGEAAFKAYLAACFLSGSLLITLEMLGFWVPLSHGMFEEFERKTAEIPGKGALFFVVGSLFLAAFSPSLEFALAVIAVLGFGDGLATVIGVRGMHRLPFNKKKSWEGALAFVVAGFVGAFFFLGAWRALSYAFLLGVVEAIDSPTDDNLLIPLTAILLNALGL